MSRLTIYAVVTAVLLSEGLACKRTGAKSLECVDLNTVIEIRDQMIKAEQDAARLKAAIQRRWQANEYDL